MTNPADKIASLQKYALNKKRSEWEVLRKDYPDVAAHVEEIANLFGKPELVFIRSDDGKVLMERGRFMSVIDRLLRSGASLGGVIPYVSLIANSAVAAVKNGVHRARR